ncbi:MAG TPA: hypothetical protein V6D26_18170 [Stenomitos sp.]
MKLSSPLKAQNQWPTFEDILQNLHAQGIYIHSEQLAEFMLGHGLPVHLRYVPAHLRSKAIEVNQNYQGDMVIEVEECNSPYWDFSWMENIQKPFIHDSLGDRTDWIEDIDQPSWDYSWMK